MDIENELYKQNPQWEGKAWEKGVEREVYLEKVFNNLKSKEIIFLIGLRRIGKTTILKQTISKLIDKKIKPSEIFFLSLDSFNLLEYSIHQLIEEYRKIQKKSVSDFFYLFLDEVT